MNRGLTTSGLVGAFALALSTAAALAQPVNFGGSQEQPMSAASSLTLVRAGGGGHGSSSGGGHGFGGGHMGFSRGGGSFALSGHRHDHRGHGFVGSGYDGYYGYDDECWFSQRYGRWVCPNY